MDITKDINQETQSPLCYEERIIKLEDRNNERTYGGIFRNRDEGIIQD